MSLVNKPIAIVKVNDKEWTLRFNLRAILALEEKFGLTLEDLQAKRQQPLNTSEAYRLTAQMLFAMTRSMEADAPSWDDVTNLDAIDLAKLEPLIFGLRQNSTSTGSLEKKGRGPAATERRGPSGISGGQSRRRASSSGRRRRKSSS